MFLGRKLLPWKALESDLEWEIDINGEPTGWRRFSEKAKSRILYEWNEKNRQVRPRFNFSYDYMIKRITGKSILFKKGKIWLEGFVDRRNSYDYEFSVIEPTGFTEFIAFNRDVVPLLVAGKMKGVVLIWD